MRNYECIYILSPDLEPEGAEKRSGEIKKTIEEAGVKVLYSESWGKRKLAYQVKKQSYGYYFFYQIELETDILKELDRLLKYQDNVIKFMIVRVESDKIGKPTHFHSEKTKEEV